MRDEMYTAVRGRGAHKDGAPLRVRHRDTLDGSVLGVGLSYDPARREAMLGQLHLLLHRAGVLRTLGSAALDLAYVAAGRFDAVWYLSLNAWDVAAGVLLVEEAGGRCSDLTGGPLRDPSHGMVASNSRLHDRFLDALR